MKSRTLFIFAIIPIFLGMIVIANVRAQYEVVDKTEEYFGTDNVGNCWLHYAKAIVILDVTEYTNPSSPNYGKLKIKFNRNIVSHNPTEQGSDLHEVHFEFWLKVGESGNWVSKRRDDDSSNSADDAAITGDYTYWYENWGTSDKTIWIKAYAKSACCPGADEPCSTSTGNPHNMYAVTNPEQKVINDSWVVPPIPEKVSIDDAPLDFGTSSTEQSFKVKNSGGNELDWQASEDYKWITGVNPNEYYNLTHNQYNIM